MSGIGRIASGLACVAVSMAAACGTLRRSAPPPIVISASVDEMTWHGWQITINDRGVFHQHNYDVEYGNREWERSIGVAGVQAIVAALCNEWFEELTDDAVWVNNVITDEPQYTIEVWLDGRHHRVQAHALDRNRDNAALARFRNVWNTIVAFAPHKLD